MIWIILYFICAIIHCGILLYVEDLDYEDPLIILAIIVSLIWPISLLISILYGLGHCVRLLLTKIIETNKKEERK